MNHAYLKAFHLIFVIIWVGGLMGLGRFLGYHVGEAAAVRERLTRRMADWLAVQDFQGRGRGRDASPEPAGR